MKKYAPRSHTKISVSVLTVLICLQPLLLGCGPGKVAPDPDAEETLWTLTNPKQSFDVFLNPDRLDYHLNDYLTLHLRVTEDAHIIIFNSDDTGKLAVLLPNAYQSNNFVKAAVTHTFPGADANFDIQLPGPVGTERFKVIALRNAADSRAITALFPQRDTTFQQVSGTQRGAVEKKILAYLRRIAPEDWAEDSHAIIIHAATPPPEPPPVAVAPVSAERFFQPLPVQDDVIIDAGTLGRYRFSMETHPPNVPSHIIRQELVDLLNTLQGILKQPMRIISGYRSRQHQIYLWAKWLTEHPGHVAALNRQGHPSWEAWVQASQTLPGCLPLQSKHQTGEAVDFYWENLALDSYEERVELTKRVREAGGTRNYTPEERQRFNILDADNYLFAVRAYPSSEGGNAAAPSGRAYFRVVYQPSVKPAMPSPERIGLLLPPPEPAQDLWTLTNPESDFAVFLKIGRARYQIGDYLTLETRVTDDAYIIIFNRDDTGKLAVLLPNTYQPDNFVGEGTTYVVPDADADFDIQLPGPAGTERFKVIALRHNRDNQNILDLFRTDLNLTSQQFWYWEHNDAQIVEKRIINYLRQIRPEAWAEDSDTAEIYKAKLPADFGPPTVVPPDYGLGDTIYIKDGSNMYFAEVIAEVGENTETVAVEIFNEELRKKLGDTVSVERVIGRRAEPPRGWGIHEIMLSFYRDRVWTFTTDVVVFEDYYRLPERINGERVRGSRKVTLGEVRIPIPVTFLSSD